MQSTDVYRTIQSGYSELFGMISNSDLEAPHLSSNQKAALNSETRGTVPFFTRKSADLKESLDTASTGPGFI